MLPYLYLNPLGSFLRRLPFLARWCRHPSIQVSSVQINILRQREWFYPSSVVVRPDQGLAELNPKRLDFLRSYLWTPVPLYSFPEPCHTLLRLLLFLVRSHRRLLQRALSFVYIIVVVPLTDNSSPILSASPPAPDNDSYDPIYYIPSENNGSIYTAESVVSKIPFSKSEYDQGVGYNPQPPTFVRQLVRSFVWLFFLVTQSTS
jgi:hypothetical protein